MQNNSLYSDTISTRNYDLVCDKALFFPSKTSILEKKNHGIVSSFRLNFDIILCEDNKLASHSASCQS